jgi:acyl carrier protein
MSSREAGRSSREAGRTETEFSSAIQDRLLSFIRGRFVPEALREGFGPETPLVELGVLDPLKASRLLNFIRRETGLPIPTALLDMTHFENVRTITAMVVARSTPLVREGRPL